MEISRDEVIEIIDSVENNTILNHILYIISFKRCRKGEIKDCSIKIWSKGFELLYFYPIYTFEFNENDHLINITDNLNPVGKLIVIIFFSLLLYFLLIDPILNFQFAISWKASTAVLVLAIVGSIIFRQFNKFKKKEQLAYILDLLEIEVDKVDPEKEWSFRNILIRLFIYPFSIAVIILSIWMLTTGNMNSGLASLFGLGICGIYLYTDIKLILKERNDRKKKG